MSTVLLCVSNSDLVSAQREACTVEGQGDEWSRVPESMLS